MTHGDQAAQRRHAEYQRSELASLSERLRKIEADLNDAKNRVEFLERKLTERDGPVQAGANALTEG